MYQNVLNRIDGVNEALAGTTFRVNPVSVVKSNHVLSGFSTQSILEDGKVHPVVYWDNSFETMSDRELARHIMNIYMDKSRTLDAGFEDYFSREYILNHVLPKVLCRDRNEKAVKDSGLPFMFIPDTDLMSVFYIPVAENSTVQINDMIMNHAGITDEELIASGKDNALREMKISSMAHVMAELAGLPFPEVEEDEMPLFVVTNGDSRFGAGLLITGQDAFHRIADVLKTDTFYILPSSIHEFLVLPAGDSPFGEDMLVSMVSEINASVVAPEDVLSDNVYRVDMKNCTFTQCR